MDADKPITRINPAQDAFDRTQAAVAIQRARKTAERKVQNRTKPGDTLAAVPVRAWFVTSR